MSLEITKMTTILSHPNSKTGKNSALKSINQFHTHLIRHRLKRSKQRDLIWAAFLMRDYVTAQNLYRLLASEGHRISLGTIYRTMNLFCLMDIAQARHFGTQTQYDHGIANGHHDYLICTQCGYIVEFDNPDIERLRQDIAIANGFSLSIQKLELYGLCATCCTQPESTPTRCGHPSPCSYRMNCSQNSISL
jgi:Fur family ferric uptake transcriptional regulator